jgi:hypothetical protein
MKRLWILTAVLSASAAWAQEPSAPPLVPADAPPMPPLESGPGTPPGPPVVMPPISNPKLGPEGAPAAAPAQPSQPQQPPSPAAVESERHFGLELAAGAGACLVGALIGSVAIAPSLGNGTVGGLDAAWGGATIGCALLAPAGVGVAGRLAGGDGSILATVVGSVGGFVIGLLALGSGGPDALPLALALPVAGSVLGFELTASGAGPPPGAALATGRPALFMVRGVW